MTKKYIALSIIGTLTVGIAPATFASEDRGEAGSVERETSCTEWAGTVRYAWCMRQQVKEKSIRRCDGEGQSQACPGKRRAFGTKVRRLRSKLQHEALQKCVDLGAGTKERHLCMIDARNEAKSTFQAKHPRNARKMQRARGIARSVKKQCRDTEEGTPEFRECMRRTKTDVQERVRSLRAVGRLREGLRKTPNNARRGSAKYRAFRRTYQHGSLAVRSAIEACRGRPKDEFRACIRDARAAGTE